jgi:hypothetical protein
MLAAIAQRLSQLATNPAEQVPARAMAARMLLLRGDTTAAIDSLLVVRPVASLPDLVWNYWEALAPERLLLARLLLARGRPAEADAVARSFDGQRTAVGRGLSPGEPRAA